MNMIERKLIMLEQEIDKMRFENDITYKLYTKIEDKFIDLKEELIRGKVI